MNDIVLSTVNLDEAIAKFTDLSKPTPVVEEVVIRNDNDNVFQVYPFEQIQLCVITA